MDKKETHSIKIECPVCGMYQNMVITRDALLSDLDKMFNVIPKKRVKEAIKKLRESLDDAEGFWWIDQRIERFEEELGLEPEFDGMKIKEDKRLKGNEFRLGESYKNCDECPRKDTDRCWVKQTGEIAGACPDLK